MIDKSERTARQHAQILLEAILLRKWPETSAAAHEELEAGHYGEALFSIRTLLNEKPETNCIATLTQMGGDGFCYYPDKIVWDRGKNSFLIELETEATYPSAPSKRGTYAWNEAKKCFQYYYLDELDHLLTYLVYRAKSPLNRKLDLKERNLRTTLIEALKLDALSADEFFEAGTPNNTLIKRQRTSCSPAPPHAHSSPPASATGGCRVRTSAHQQVTAFRMNFLLCIPLLTYIVL